MKMWCILSNGSLYVLNILNIHSIYCFVCIRQNVERKTSSLNIILLFILGSRDIMILTKCKIDIWKQNAIVQIMEICISIDILRFHDFDIIILCHINVMSYPSMPCHTFILYHAISWIYIGEHAMLTNLTYIQIWLDILV